jgi:peptidyl-prolyl cis-trans isomerase B (cyclophilin B)
MSKVTEIERTGNRRFSAAPARLIDTEKGYVATMKTSKGDITIALTPKETPETVNNFVVLACTGYYDGLNFHRVIASPPFMVQGGCPLGTGTGGPGYQFKDEFSPSLRHDEGVISMANAGPGTNGSQFFITLAPQPHLNDHHSVFGRVTAGMDVVRAIRQGDKIDRVEIEEK